MPEVGSASFSARANFLKVVRAAKDLAKALREVEKARERASGPVDVTIDDKGLKTLASKIEKATADQTVDIEVVADVAPFWAGVLAAVGKASDQTAEVTVEGKTSPFLEAVLSGVAKANASKVEIDVEGQTTPFLEAVYSGVEKANDQVAAIQVKADTKRLKPEVEAAVRGVQAQIKRITVPADLDDAPLEAGLKRLKIRTKDGTFRIDVPVGLEGAGLAAELNRLLISVKARTTGIDIPVGVDGSGVRAKVSLIAKMASLGQKVKLKVDVDGAGLKNVFKETVSGGKEAAASLTSAFTSVLKVPALVTGLNIAASAVSAIGAAAFMAGAALAPLAGLMAVGAGVAVAYGGALASIKLAFSGVVESLQAYKSSQKTASAGASQAAAQDVASAKAREAAVRGVAQAQRGLADSVKQASDLQVAASKRVAAAERSLSQAQKAQMKAQVDLTKARRDAIETLSDMRRENERGSLTEARALLSIEQAKKSLADVQADPASTDLERRDAILAVQEAEADLKDVIDSRQDSQLALNEAEAAGIEGSQTVVDARQAVEDANLGVLDSQSELVASQAGVAEAQIAGAQLVADANLALSDALRAVADAASNAGSVGATALDPFAESLKSLPASAQGFVGYLVSLDPLLQNLKKTAADNLFPGLTDGLKNVTSLAPIAEGFIGSMSLAIGDAARNLSTLALDPGFQSDLKSIGETGVRTFSKFAEAVRPLVAAFVGVVAAAGPLIDLVVAYVSGLAQAGAASLTAATDSGKVGKFFEETGRVFIDVMKTIGNVLGGLVEIGKVAYDVIGGTLTDGLKKGSESFKEWTKSAEGQAKIKEIFESAIPVFKEVFKILKDLGEIFGGLGKDEGLADLLKQIRLEILPAIRDLTDNTSKGLSSAFITSLAQVIQLIANLSSEGGGLTKFVGVLNSFLEVVNKLFKKFPILSKLFALLGTGLAVLAVGKLLYFVSGLKMLVGVIGTLRAAAAAKAATDVAAIGTSAAAAAPGLTAAGVAGGEAGVGLTAAGAGATAAGLPLWAIIAIIAAVIIALVALAIVVVKNWDTIKQAFQDGVDAIGKIFGVQSLTSVISGWLDSVVDLFRGKGQEAAEEWEKALNGVGEVAKKSEMRNARTTDKFDKAAQAALDEYEAAVAVLDKDVRLGLMDEAAYDDAIKNLDRFLETKQDILRSARDTERRENDKARFLETLAAQEEQRKTAERLLKQDPKFFEKELEGRGGFDPGMNVKSERAGQIVDVIDENGTIGKLQAVGLKIQFFFEDLARGIGAVFTGVTTAIAAWALGVYADIVAAWEAIKLAVTTKIAEIALTISTTWENIKTDIRTKIESVRAGLQLAWDNIKTDVQTRIDNIRAAISATWEAIKTDVSTRIENIRADIQARWDGIVAGVKATWDGLSASARTIWDSISGIVSGVVTGIGSSITTFLSDPIGAVKGVWEGLQTTASNVWNGIVTTVESAATRVGNAIRSIPGLPSLGGVGRFFGNLFGAADGGQVPGRGSGDTVPAMLTPGEFVATKKTVQRIGVGAFDALNRGQATITPLDDRRRRKYSQGGSVSAGVASAALVARSYGVQRLASGGVVDSMNMMAVMKPNKGMKNVQTSLVGGVASGGGERAGTVVNIVVNNPVAQTAEDSIHRTMQKVAAHGLLADLAG